MHKPLIMDNGFVEKGLSASSALVGRNNWLFSGTPEGANASALFYSFIVTAKINGVNPPPALSKIFELLPLSTTIDDYERLADLLFSPSSLH